MKEAKKESTTKWISNQPDFRLITKTNPETGKKVLYIFIRSESIKGEEIPDELGLSLSEAYLNKLFGDNNE